MLTTRTRRSRKTAARKSRRPTRRLKMEPLEQRQLLAVVFADSFENGQWDGQWAEDSQNDWFDSAQRATDGARSAEVDGRATDATLTMDPAIDMTAYGSAELTFDWLIEKDFRNGEYLALDFSPDGSNWTEVDRLSGNTDPENTWHNETITIDPAYLTGAFQMRYRAKAKSDRADANVDNVQITGTLAGPPEISISDVTVTEGDASIQFIDAFVTAGSGGLRNARGIEYGSDGTLYVSGNSDPSDPAPVGFVNRYDGVTGAFIDVFASGPLMTGAKDVEFGPDGDLYVTNNRDSEVFRIDAATGAIEVFVSSGSGGLDTPRQLIFGPDGNNDGTEDLYVVSANTDSILRYDGVTGAFLGVFVTAGSGGLNEPTAITFGPGGNFYVASGAHEDFFNSILRYDSSGNFLDVFVDAGSAGLTLAPTAGMIFGPDVNSDGTADMYISNGEVDEPMIFNGADGSFVEKFITSGQGGLDDPKGLLFDNDGNLLVVNNGDHSVRRFGSASQAVFNVSLSSPSADPVTVDFATADGTASAGADYTTATGTLTFAPGETSKTIVVSTLDDDVIEPDETFTVNLSNETGATIADGTGEATIIDDDAAPTISFADFSDSTGLNLIGRAAITPENILRLTPAEQGAPGGAWFTQQQFVSIGFETTFQFQMTEGSGGADDGADGFAFLIQNFDDSILGAGGRHLGYFEISNSLAVEFDTIPDTGEPSDSHVSVQTRGRLRNDDLPAFSLGSFATSGFKLDDGNVHTAKITYTPGTLSIFLDDLASPALTIPIDLAELLDLNLGRAWVGFTAATGGGWENHDILNWEFGNSVDISTTIAIADVGHIEGDAGSSDAVFTVSRFGDSSASVTIDWSTASGTATAGTDYDSSTGQITFAPGEIEKTIAVSITGDSNEEDHETFFVDISLAAGAATLVDNRGVGTILNDETSLTISDVTVTEGSETIRFIDTFIESESGGLNAARGLRHGPDGNLYLNSTMPSAVLRYDAVTGSFIDRFAETPGSIHEWFKDIQFGPDGNLYVSDNVLERVLRFDGLSGDFIDVFVSEGSGGLDTLRSLNFGLDNNLYVASAKTDEILRYQGPSGASPGTFMGAFVSAGSGGLDSPGGHLFGPDGNLYVASGAGDSVLRFDGTTGNYIDDFVSTGAGGLDGPRELAFGPDVTGDGVQDLYVSTSINTNEVLLFDGSTGAFIETVVPEGLGGLSYATTLLFDSDGNLLVVNNANDSVGRYGKDSQAVFTVTLSKPSGVAVTVEYTTADGNAVAGSDYTAVNGTITFAPGVTTRTIIVSTIDDELEEPTESFFVNLSAATGATIQDSQGEATIVDDNDGEVFPNDPLFSQQWNLHNTGQTGGLYDADFDAPAAWSITTGSMSTVIAMLDNGIDYTHEDLYLNIFLNQGEIPTALASVLVDTDADGLITFRDLNDPANASFVSDSNGTGYIDAGDLLADPAWENGIDEDGNGFMDDLVGWDFQDNDNDPGPVDGKNHGTGVAGQLGAIGNNGVGMTGVNWAVQMMPIRTHYSNATRDNNNSVAGLDYAVATGATISNNSWGDYTYSQVMYDAIQRAGTNGHLFVAAAGNDSFDSDVTPLYPGAYDLDNIINVTVANQQNELYLANYGVISVDLGSPGLNIQATVIGDTYVAVGATSAATPQVTGVAALIRTLHPDWTYSQIKAQILSTVDPLPAFDGRTVTGGRLNAAAAVANSSIHVSDPSLVEGNTGTTDLVFTVSRRGDTSGSVTLDWATGDGSATAGSDYVAASGTIQFLAGETSKTISVQIVGDAIAELDETLFVNLSLGAGNVLIADSTSQGIILNDDAPAPTTRFFVVDNGVDDTFEYDAAGNLVTSSNLASANSNARGAAASADGSTVWVVDSSDKVYVYDGEGNLQNSWTAGGLNRAEGIATDETDIWILDGKSKKVLRYGGAAASGTSGTVNPTSSFSLDGANSKAKGITTDGTSIWVVNDDRITDKVFKYDAATGTLFGSWAIDGANAKPTGVTIDPSGASDSIWIVDSGADAVYEYGNALGNSGGNLKGSFALAGDNTNPQGIADPPAEATTAATDQVFSQEAADPLADLYWAASDSKASKPKKDKATDLALMMMME